MGQNDAAGNAYGGYFETAAGGAGTRYGIFAASDQFAGWFQGGRVHVGDAGAQDWVTGDGDLYVENVLEADGNAYVGGDAAVFGGNLGIGTTPASTYSIVNDPATAPAYGAYLYGTLAPVYATLSSDPTDHYAYLASQPYGIYARNGNSDETGDRYGGRFTAYSQDSAFGVYGLGYGYSVDGAYGAVGYGSNTATGNAYGGYFTATSSGTGTHYGVYSTVSDDYAGWFQGGRVHVGNSGTENYADGDGDLYLEDELEADGDAFIGGDLSVFGANIGLGTLANSAYGITNNSATAPTYGALLNGTSAGLYGRLSTDPSSHYGYLGSLSTGVYGRAGTSSDTGTRYGAQFYGYTQDLAYGVSASAYGYSVDTTTGAYGYGSNSSSGLARGVHGNSYKSGGSGDCQGVYGYAYNYSSGDAYGGYFTTSTSGTGTHYGVYAQADDYPVYAAYGPDPSDHYALMASATNGIYARSGNSDETGSRWGGSFSAFTQGTAYGVVVNSYGYGASYNYGTYNNATNSGGGNAYAVFGYATATGGGTAYGIYSAAGLKNWVNPDPEDPDQAIAYVTVESGENVTYYAGRGRLVDGRAEITLPDHFRKVTSPDHPVIVQLTPRSAQSLGLAAVESDNTGLTVVELSGGHGDYEFDYTVKGMRLGYEDYEPIIDNVDYVPFQGNQAALDDTEMTTQEFYDRHSEGIKKIFKANGTLTPDGKVNEAMFQKKGWKLNKEKKPKTDRP